MKAKKIICIPNTSDSRFSYLKRFLSERGHTVTEQCTSGCQILIGGIPFHESELLSYPDLSTLTHVFGGMVSPKLFPICRQLGIHLIDYMKDETLVKYNAIATAEGVIAEAIKASSWNLSEARVLILGYGHCGQRLFTMLAGLGCRVTICIRNESLRTLLHGQKISVLSFEDLSSDSAFDSFSLIVNTVPARILSPVLLSKIPSGTLLFDIASAPGGFDPADANQHKINWKRLPGLPGKYAPEASARAILTCLTEHTVL